MDEALRLDPPVLLTGRVCARTTSVAAIEVREGTNVVTVLADTNRDPLLFEHPDAST